MSGFYKGNIPIISDDVASLDLAFPRQQARGLVPRDLTVDPPEIFEPPDQIPLIPESDWDAWYDEEEEKGNSLEHMFLQGGNQPLFVNLDQDGDGYCWAYSTAQAVMLRRAFMNQPHVRLNPHSVAAIIKNGRDEGGWCGLSAKFFTEIGCAEEGDSSGQWPLHSRNLRYDTSELRARMARYKITESWVDLARPVYSQNLTRLQQASCLLRGMAGPSDYNWWGHSVCALRWVRIEKGSWGPLILNSWKGWGRFGLGVLQGSRANCDGALTVRDVVAA